MDRRPTLAFCLPSYGPIESEVVQSHFAAIANASRVFDIKFIGMTHRGYLHTAANNLAQASLESTVDFVFFTEADMILPFDIITKLYEDIKRTDLDACSGLYFLRGNGTQPCLYNRDMTNKKNPYAFIPVLLVPENELFTIDCPGMGCTLFKTDVFRKVPYPWFDLKEGKYGQDIYFWSKAKDAGIKCGVDTAVQCGHLCERRVVSITDYRAWLESKECGENKKGGFVVTSPRNSMTKV